MKHNTMKRLLSVVLCVVLVAALALNFAGCSSTKKSSGEKAFTLVVTDLEGNDKTFDITTTKATVGEALLDEGLIAGDDSEFGLMVNTVDGVTADWNADQTYWAFYIDGEYAATGVSLTDITDGATYSFVLTKG